MLGLLQQSCWAFSYYLHCTVSLHQYDGKFYDIELCCLNCHIWECQKALQRHIPWYTYTSESYSSQRGFSVQPKHKISIIWCLLSGNTDDPPKLLSRPLQPQNCRAGDACAIWLGRKVLSADLPRRTCWSSVAASFGTSLDLPIRRHLRRCKAGYILQDPSM